MPVRTTVPGTYRPNISFKCGKEVPSPVHLKNVPNVAGQYGGDSFTDDLGGAGQVRDARVHVRLERHQRPTAADLEQLLLHEVARLVGEGQHAERSA